MREVDRCVLIFLEDSQALDGVIRRVRGAGVSGIG
jgi:hypothetical protein